MAEFFSRPKDFLEETIEGLAAEGRAAIALVFLNGGQVRSPVPTEMLQQPGLAFGVASAAVRMQLEALNGSILNLVEDEEGPYWTYRHPTIADAFASYVAKSPELIEIYLRGAKPESLLQEVVCAGASRQGALVTVPNSLHDVLADRIANLSKHSLSVFISYRSNTVFSKRLLELRPDLWTGLRNFFRPLCDDLDVDLLTALHQQGLLPEELRLAFVSEVQSAAIEDADASFLDHSGIANTLTKKETDAILQEVRIEVLGKLDRHIDRVRGSWDRDYDPSDHFSNFRSAVRSFTKALEPSEGSAAVDLKVDWLISNAVSNMEQYYETGGSGSAPVQQSIPQSSDSLDDLFRDIDE